MLQFAKDDSPAAKAELECSFLSPLPSRPFADQPPSA